MVLALHSAFQKSLKKVHNFKLLKVDGPTLSAFRSTHPDSAHIFLVVFSTSEMHCDTVLFFEV